MRKPRNSPATIVGAAQPPAWAADWITTPADDEAPEGADELVEDLDEERDGARATAADVLAAIAGGALTGLAIYGVNRVVEHFAERLVDRAAETPSARSGKAKRRSRKSSHAGGARTSRSAAQPSAAPAAGARTFSDWVAEARRVEEAIRRAQAEAQRRARAAAPPPPAAEPDDDERQDREAAALLGVDVDASADDIAKAWRRLVRQKMEAGAFHDQPGADVAETARLISAKNRLLERARRRGGAGSP